MGLTPGLGRSPAEGNGNPLQYSCLENSMVRGVWWDPVQGVKKEPDITEHTHTRQWLELMLSLQGTGSSPGWELRAPATYTAQPKKTALNFSASTASELL